MRETQIVGLHDDADEYLKKNAKMTYGNVCPECGHRTGSVYVQNVYDRETGVRMGMFEDGPLLNEYHLKDGSVVREVVQMCQWSSGPMIFLCLEDDKGNRFAEWSDEEISREISSEF